MADVQLALRIESGIKEAAEVAAEAAGMSLTAFVERALRLSTLTTCPECGRTSGDAFQAPGLSQQFTTWLDQRRGSNPNGNFVLFTAEAGVQKIYWGRLHDARPGTNEALILYCIIRTPFDPAVEPVAIPRGFIMDWRDDIEGHLYQQMLFLGYADGNAMPRAIYNARHSGPRGPKRR